MRLRPHLIALSACAALLGACASTPLPQPIPATAAAAPSLSTLTKLIQDAGLSETLAAAGPYTVFAPSDEAFKAVPAKTLEKLAGDKEALKALLAYHVVPGQLMAAQVKPGKLKTLNGAELQIALAGPFVTADEALVTQADVAASNGVVHVIDKVLMPPAPKK
ncbi:fasciclin domain-containing protein [Piscinibacter sp. Jin2]|uniref:Fasciclin domain-containing protein n=1 Tax=Aquariibacter lacus TaxID=2801332 RepID=A0A9X0XJA3_9BURK|nr:fasciclin domain-containing protein [Piscinibacter lacus]MBL0720500.1 fasciclin domain-containing protein [Piscinibacter lacus]